MGKELEMDNQKPCRCLEIIDERLNEISRKNEIYRKTTPSETIDENDFYKIQDVLKIFEKDFYEIQALLKIYDKILAEKNKE